MQRDSGGHVYLEETVPTANPTRGENVSLFPPDWGRPSPRKHVFPCENCLFFEGDILYLTMAIPAPVELFTVDVFFRQQGKQAWRTSAEKRR